MGFAQQTIITKQHTSIDDTFCCVELGANLKSKHKILHTTTTIRNHFDEFKFKLFASFTYLPQALLLVDDSFMCFSLIL